jgi:hypothetical protein
MAKKIFGRVIDNENKAVEFATVFVSDANGKPIGNVATTTNDKGQFSFNSLNDSDFLTARLVGLEPKTVSVKNAINVPSPLGNMPTVAIKMNPSAGANLQEVVVTATKPQPPKPQDTKPKTEKPKVEEGVVVEEPKKGMSKGLKIGLIVGGGLLLLIIVGVVLKQSTKDK